MTGDLFGTSNTQAPLADRMRPRAFEELVGQEDLFAPGAPLALMKDATHLSSVILWGPPGSGKTTIAHLIARTAGVPFVAYSAVISGVKEIKETMQRAAVERRASGKPTLLFVDEVHRFNRAQQDAFLSHVERGDIVLVGATTENPSFEVNSALLSRTRVVVLRPLAVEDLVRILEHALLEPGRGLGGKVEAAPEVLRTIAESADGDARQALTTLEIAAAGSGVGPGGARGRIDIEDVRAAVARKHLRNDKAGEEHFNLISALHKSLSTRD